MSFLRGEGVVCGTSTTGTGTLTLAACPSPPGGVDPYAAFTVNASLGTSNSIPMTYTVMEYTDSTFATAKQMEKGVGALTLGASITATTLARTTPQSTATGMNTSTPTYSTGAPTAISIGTAANVLVFVGASATDLPAFSPYFESSVGDGGVPPDGAGVYQSGRGIVSLTTLQDLYSIFRWSVPMLVKRATCYVNTSTTGTTNLYSRIYEINSSGRPGKLLYDFGVTGTANSSLNSTGKISSGAAGSGFMLLPGEYFFDVVASFSTGSPALVAFGTNSGSTSNPPFALTASSGRLGSTMSNFTMVTQMMTASSGTAGAAPDPANLTSYNLGPLTNLAGPVWFILAPS